MRLALRRRTRDKLVLEERLRFETLLAELSAGLIHVPAGAIDAALERALRQVVTFLGVDRGTVDVFEDVAGGQRISWAVSGLGESPSVLDAEQFPWTAKQLGRGDIVRFSPGDELPEEAAVDRASFERTGMRSKVCLPLSAGGPMLGALSFGSARGECTWPAELVERLRLLSEAFASALERKRVELSLAERLRFEKLLSSLSTAFSQLSAGDFNREVQRALQAAQRLLAADVVDLEEVREILSDIVADDKRAAAVIHRLRILLRKGDLEFVPLDVNDIVGEVAWLVRSDALVRNVSMSLELAPDLPRVLGDRVQLQQVVLNLVLNGLEALRPPSAGPRTLVIRTAPDGAAAVSVAVQDSGTGIDEKDTDRIFEPLYTTKPEGLGMGLAIARTIVDAHGGRLAAANNDHGGATVRFTLPVGRKDEC